MRFLYVTTIGGTMRFFRQLIKELIEAGHTVDIAANTSISNVPAEYIDLGCKIMPISCTRSPLNKGTFTTVKELKHIVSEGAYDIVHCHTPIAAMCTRIACRKVRRNGTKVFYTAHGFHFYKGAPLKNWLLYYPVEKLCAPMTDVLITINQEDYALVQKKLRAGKVEYVPGVGIDVAKFANTIVDRDSKRDEIGVPRDATVLLSVGDLNQNKNHAVIIKALARMDNKNIHYAIAGKGPLGEYLSTLARELGIHDQVHLLGFRSDAPELYKSADLYVFPSIREGLGLSAIEGMAAGLPLIVSDNRGTKSYAVNNVNALVCPAGNDASVYADAIDKMINNISMRKTMGEYNREYSWKFEVKKINEKMKEIYGI